MPSSPKSIKTDLAHQPTARADEVEALQSNKSVGSTQQNKSDHPLITDNWPNAFAVSDPEIQLILDHLSKEIQEIMDE